MDLWRSLSGILDVELTSAEPEAALGAVSESGIEMIHIQQRNLLTYRLRIRRQDYPAMERLCRKRGESLKILKKRGLYWICRGLLQRPVLIGGLAFFFLFALFLPTRVLFVRVEGNQTVPKRRILSAAESSGICFGASRREVRSEKVKNALLEAVPQLQWAGVNTAGCVATISVRERFQQEPAAQSAPVTSIVAARDGYILSGTVVRGNGLFRVGQTVKEGQVLISGYTDCGLCIQATQAEGEIQAQTRRQFTAVTPAARTLRGGIKEERKTYSLLIGKKRINLWKDSRNIIPGCDRMYQEYYVTLPGGFTLPAAICVETYSLWETLPGEVTLEEAKEALREFAQRYLSEKMIAGSVLSRLESLEMRDGVYCLDGEYICTEMIGRVRKEQIGEYHGEDG